MTHNFAAEYEAAHAIEARELDTYRWLALLVERGDQEPRRSARLRWEAAKRTTDRIWANWINVGMP